MKKLLKTFWIYCFSH